MSKDRVQLKQVDRIDDKADGKPDTLRRVEILTGIGRRRRFSNDTKARIVLESRAPGAVVSEVARRHGLTPQQLFGWRRKLRQAMSVTAPLAEIARATTSVFTPVVVTAEGASSASRDQTEAHARPTVERVQVEIIIGEVIIRLGEGVAPRTIAAVLRAVRAVS